MMTSRDILAAILLLSWSIVYMKFCKVWGRESHTHLIIRKLHHKHTHLHAYHVVMETHPPNHHIPCTHHNLQCLLCCSCVGGSNVLCPTQYGHTASEQTKRLSWQHCKQKQQPPHPQMMSQLQQFTSTVQYSVDTARTHQWVKPKYEGGVPYTWEEWVKQRREHVVCH